MDINITNLESSEINDSVLLSPREATSPIPTRMCGYNLYLGIILGVILMGTAFSVQVKKLHLYHR